MNTTSGILRLQNFLLIFHKVQRQIIILLDYINPANCEIRINFNVEREKPQLN